MKKSAPVIYRDASTSQKQPHKGHNHSHLEPKTPLSSSSTVLSLFCSSFSRSLASASSCQRQKKMVTPLLLHSTNRLTKPLNLCFLGLGCESGGTHRGVTCLVGGLRLILPATCVERYPEYKRSASPQSTAIMTAHRVIRYGVSKENAGLHALERLFFFSTPTATQIYGETISDSFSILTSNRIRTYARKV